MDFSKDTDKSPIEKKVAAILARYDEIQNMKKGRNEFSDCYIEETKLAAYVWDMHNASKDIANKYKENTILSSIASKKLENGDDYSYFHSQIIDLHQNLQKDKNVIATTACSDTRMLYSAKHDYLAISSGKKKIKDIFKSVETAANNRDDKLNKNQLIAHASDDMKTKTNDINLDFKKDLFKQAIILSEYSDADIAKNIDVNTKMHTDVVSISNNIKTKCDAYRKNMIKDMPTLTENINNISNSDIVNIMKTDKHAENLVSDSINYYRAKSFASKYIKADALNNNSDSPHQHEFSKFPKFEIDK